MDLTARFGRGFSAANLFHMRKFFLSWPVGNISQTSPVKSNEESTGSLPDQISQTVPVKSASGSTLGQLGQVAGRFQRAKNRNRRSFRVIPAI
ncbi:MAG: hypothetical protein JO077_25950 [Verrucomicrobia bacterium]|nr:hypothetical protein [Verrucomicrobiota bacterium]